MKIFNDFNSDEIVDILNNGSVGVMPTDTIYGIVASVLNKSAVERIYEIKGRTSDKPLIVLISSISDLEKFGIELSISSQNFLEKYWPGKVSVILPVKGEKFYYLHRGANSIAFRLPKDNELIQLIQKTGPLVAPSANPEGRQSANDIMEAIEYFGENADFYIDGGVRESEPSTLVDMTSGTPIILRRGAEEIV